MSFSIHKLKLDIEVNLYLRFFFQSSIIIFYIVHHYVISIYLIRMSSFENGKYEVVDDYYWVRWNPVKIQKWLFLILRMNSAILGPMV